MLKNADFLLTEAINESQDSEKGPVFAFYYNFMIKSLK